MSIGSTSMKQLKVLDNITQKLKTLVLQDGTKNMLGNCKRADEIFQDLGKNN